MEVRQTASLYSEFQNLLKQGQVKEISIRDNTIRGELKQALPDGRQKFVTTRVDPGLARDLAQFDVKFTGVIESTFLRDILSWVLPALVFVGIWMFAMKKFADKQGLGGSLMSIGKSKAKVYVETNTGVTFADVAGVDEAKEELQEIVGFLKDPKEFGRLGGRVPRGVLLLGPPGTAKTLLAKAVAGEAGVPFFSISGSEFVEMFVGVGAARVRDLFEQARQKPRRSSSSMNWTPWAAPAALSAWVVMTRRSRPSTNCWSNWKVSTPPLASCCWPPPTGRKSSIPPCCEPVVLIVRCWWTVPTARAASTSSRCTCARSPWPTVSVDKIAELKPGFSGADLATLCNEAALVATRRRADAVDLNDFTAAVERIVAGLEKKNRVLIPHERRVVAHHEMGHALVAMSLPGDPTRCTRFPSLRAASARWVTRSSVPPRTAS